MWKIATFKTDRSSEKARNSYWPIPLQACATSQDILHYSKNKSHWSQPKELTENINTIFIFLESVLSHSLLFFFFFCFILCVLTESKIECQLSRARVTDSCGKLNSDSLLFTLVFWDMSQCGVQNCLRLHKYWDKMCVIMPIIPNHFRSHSYSLLGSVFYGLLGYLLTDGVYITRLTSNSKAWAMLLPQPPEYVELHRHTGMPITTVEI